MSRTSAPASAVRESLVRWFRAFRRALPWRETTDAYAIWVSEVMLQQTRVETVIPYYRAFLERFPDAHALAAAAEDEVMSRWSGLGYYRRARLLHSGAREVVARYDGKVPENAEQRRALPGIGRYTAGAIGSIAFGLEEPIVDGNVARVLSRLDGMEHDPASPDGRRALWARAGELVRGDSPGDLNQALMELGATVCVPRDPRCVVCPLAPMCSARQTGRVAELPATRPKRAPRIVDEVALCAGDGHRVVLLRREQKGLFGGLWQLPRADGHGPDAARTARLELGDSPSDVPIRLGVIERLLTHRRIRVEVWRTGLPSTLPPGALAMDENQRDSVGISTFTRAVLERADYRDRGRRRSSHSRATRAPEKKDRQ